MAQLVRTFTVDRPVEEVFDVLADFSTAGAWDPAMAGAVHAGGPRVGEDARFRLHVDLPGPLTVPLTYETTTYVRPSRVVHRVDSAFVRGRDNLTVRSVEGGTEVTWDAEFALRGPGALLDPMWQRGFEGIADDSIAGLVAFLQQGGTGHHPDMDPSGG